MLITEYSVYSHRDLDTYTHTHTYMKIANIEWAVEKEFIAEYFNDRKKCGCNVQHQIKL